ncbi:MAG: WecB/TagA/CpsF family glycosyltransferase [Hyphomicrobiales bacterium]|nr:WecB/TagA/CpsF family glycosyltransferase [Hyphomicrobiales bacterium]
MTNSDQDALVIGPLKVLRTTRERLAALARAAMAAGGRPLAVAFCNAHTAEIALHDAAYAQALQRFLVVNDGVGLEIAARILEGRGFPENLNGTDFMPFLFSRLERPARVYLLGARPGVAAEAARRFAEVFPNVAIVGARDGYFSTEDEAAVVAEVAAAAPEILMVAFGNPKQEFFIDRHLEGMAARATFGVGALFDFTAGRVVRAPGWVRRLRLEWAFRLAQEPLRLLRRYTIETGGFLIAVLRLRFAARKIP